MDEIEGRQAAEHPQKHVEGNILHGERRDGSGEGTLFSQNQIAHQGGRYGTEQQGQHPAHAQVEKENLQGEEHAGQGGVEDARHGSGRPAAQQERHTPVGHAAVSAQIGADGGAGIHDGSLRTHRSAEADGEGAGNEGTPAIVPLDAGFVLGDGLQHLGNAMADIVLDHIADNHEA